jgi:cathepsin L
MKFVLFACAVLCFSLVAATRTESEYLKAWLDFTAKYSKTYKHDEVQYRYQIFKKTVDFIDSHNAKLGTTYTVGINQFSDLTPHEFQTYYMGTRVDASTYHGSGKPQRTQPNFTAASGFDWRTKGAVTPIKNQGQCGSCWSFSTTGSMEGCHFITTGTLVSLSEQNLVDCSQAQGNEGCNGGLMDDAFNYIIQNNGIDTESSYPYTAEDGTCQYAASNCGSTLATSGYTDVTSGSETALLQAVTITPTSVAIDASQPSFQSYTSGVYYEPACSSTQLDHGVLAVGWGTDASGNDYWIVKNSWGTDWGMSGYIYMSRNKSNNCGIATMASYPDSNTKACGGCGSL